MSRPVRTTRAQAALAEWLKRTGTSQEALATRLGVSQPLIAYWLRGTARPSSELRAAVHAVCGIAVDDWLDAAERIAVERMATG